MTEIPPPPQARENWGSRAGFVLAAIGSAVGLGNLWGFPYKLYSYGGGAFLIPYLLAMLFIGIPLLILEFSLGHMTQKAAPDAYRAINRKSEPVGWWGILLGFVIITYYPVILAYCVNYFVECASSIATGAALPWAGQGAEGVARAESYFFSTYLSMWGDGHTGKPWDFGALVTPIAVALVVVWVLMYFCIFRGVKLVSKVVLWTVPLPWIMLLVLAIRGLTLPGAQAGLNFYLDPDMDKLAQPETWRWAFGQMFFSMSLAFGVMITYASFLHRKSDINNNAAIIGLADVGTSFIAGLAVFATLGGMAYATAAAGAPVGVGQVAKEGPGLAFVAFPYALAQLPAAPWFGAIFFLTLILLGIDSAFSITESVLASLVDKTGWNRNWTLIGMSAIGLAVGVVYCTRGGLIWLGSMDDFINSTWGGIALLGLLEFVVIGWGYRLGRLRAHANERSDWKLGVWWEWIVRYVAPLALSVLFVWSVIDRTADAEKGFLYSPTGQLQVPMLVGLILAVLAPIASLVLSLIHSPGANQHAAHVGQPRTGRGLGTVAALLVATALIGMAWAGVLTWKANHTANVWVEGLKAQARAGVALSPRPEAVAAHRDAAAAPTIVAGALALAGLALGSMIVGRGERRSLRPSGLGRWAAGWGIVLVGAAAAIGLSFYVLEAKMNAAPGVAADMAAKAAAEQAPAVVGQMPAAVEQALAAPATAAELSSMSYLVLAGMLTLLVGGLGWCFYRAVKAAGGAEEPQVAEE